MATVKTGADSARRALDLLFAFEDLPVASVKELAETTSMPLPTTHRYVAMLREMGLIDEARHGMYRLTMRVAALAHAARRGASVIDVVQPFMQTLSDELEETVLLVQPVVGLPVCTHRIETGRPLRLSFDVGQHMPPLRGASAHLLLASYPEEERYKFVAEAIARGEQPPLSSIDEFLKEVRRDGERGWAVSSAEINEGVWSAAAIIKGEGKPIGTVSVPCPVFRLDAGRSEAVLESVRWTAEQISTALGSFASTS